MKTLIYTILFLFGVGEVPENVPQKTDEIKKTKPNKPSKGENGAVKSKDGDVAETYYLEETLFFHLKDFSYEKQS